MKKYLLPLLLASCLSACAQQSLTANSLSLGKQNFNQQNYGIALKQLLPAANKGNADAQYAVGYMYFYGLGTKADPKMAKLWIQESARQGNPAAERALSLMDSNAWTQIKR